MFDRPGRPWLRRDLLLVGLGVCVAFLGWILLWPRGYYASRIIIHTTQALDRLGLPTSLVTTGRVEFALNAAMVAPVVVLAVLLWPRWSWERCTAYAFVASCAVELVQGLLLPSRTAQFVDVVANTIGAGVGAILGHGALALSRRRGRAARVAPARDH